MDETRQANIDLNIQTDKAKQGITELDNVIKDKFKSINQQVKECQREVDKLLQGKSSNKFLNLDDAKYELRMLTQSQQLYNATINETNAREKALQQEQRTRIAIAKQASEEQQKILNSQKSTTQQMVDYETQLSKLRKQSMNAYMGGDMTGYASKKAEFETLNRQLVDFNKQFGISNRGFYELGNNVDYFFAKLRSHMAWIVTGLALGALVQLPIAINNSVMEVEQLVQKMRQNLELNERYHGQNELLNNDLKSLRETATLFAVGYGADLKEVMDAQQLLSRRFKDPDTINFMTNLALTMHKLDFTPLQETARNLEAVALQFKLISASDVTDFVNQFTVAVHTANITGTDLLAALQRSGSAFKQFNMGTAESIAMIATLSNATARHGREIGNSLKSILTNMDFTKMTQALDILGIKVYDSANKMRPGILIFEEMFEKLSTMDEKSQRAFEIITGGGKLQANMSAALMQNGKALKKMYEDLKMANSDLTATLLAQGLDSYANRVKQLTVAMSVLGTTIAYDAVPALKDMAMWLLSGVQALTEHKDAVSKAISFVVTLTEAMMLMRLAAFAVNTEIYKATFGTAAAAVQMDLFGSATLSTSGKVWALVGSLGAALARLGIFMAIAQGLSMLVEQRGLNNSASRAEGIVQNAYSGNVDDVPENIKELDKLLTKRKELRQGSVDVNTTWDQQEKNKEELANVDQSIAMQLRMTDQKKMMDDINKRIDLSNVKLGTSAGTSGTDNTPLGKPKTEGGENRNPNSLDNFTMHREMNDLLAEAKLKTDAYTAALDDLNTKEKLYGVSASTVIESIKLKTDRQKELSEEQTKYNALAEEYKNTATEMIEKDSSLTAKMKEYNLTVKDLSKSEYRELIQDNQYVQKLLDNYNKLAEAASKAGVEEKKTKNDRDLLYYGDSLDPMKQQEYNRRMAGYQEKSSLAGVNPLNPLASYEKIRIQLKALKEEQTAYYNEMQIKQGELNKMLDNPDAAPGDIKKWREEVAKLKSQYDETTAKIRDKTDEMSQDTKKFYADTFADIIVEGKSFEDVMKGIWKQIAKEAINQLFGVKQATSFLGTLMGGGKKGGAGGGAGVVTTVPIFAHGGENITGFPKMHSGGVVPYLKNDEVIRTLQSGEEVNSRQERRTIDVMSDIIKQMNEKQSAQIINITALDSKSFAEYMSQHSDLFVALMRKEKAMGNGI